MYTEVTHNNAVVRVFVKLLQETVDRKKLSLPRDRGGAYLQLKNHCNSSSNSTCSDDGKMTLYMSVVEGGKIELMHDGMIITKDDIKYQGCSSLV